MLQFRGQSVGTRLRTNKVMCISTLEPPEVRIARQQSIGRVQTYGPVASPNSPTNSSYWQRGAVGELRSRVDYPAARGGPTSSTP